MLSEGVLRTAKELVRQSQNAECRANVLASQILKLQRVTALRSDTPVSDVIELRDELETHISHRYVLDAITARVVDVVDEKVKTPSALEAALDALVEQVGDSESELVEQLAASIVVGDRLMIICEPEGGVVESAIKEAADVLTSDFGACDLDVTVVKLLPNDGDMTECMGKRLGCVDGVEARVIEDVCVTHWMRRCTKVIVSGVGVDVDDGMACVAGSAMVSGVATRMRVAVVGAVSKFRMMPVGSGCVAALGLQQRYPGCIWDYDESRDDGRREAVAMVAPAFDVITMPKFDMIVTEGGGCSPEYVVHLIPAYEKTEGDGEDQGDETPDEQQRGASHMMVEDQG